MKNNKLLAFTLIIPFFLVGCEAGSLTDSSTLSKSASENQSEWFSIRGANVEFASKVSILNDYTKKAMDLSSSLLSFGVEQGESRALFSFDLTRLKAANPGLVTFKLFSKSAQGSYDIGEMYVSILTHEATNHSYDMWNSPLLDTRRILRQSSLPVLADKFPQKVSYQGPEITTHFAGDSITLIVHQQYVGSGTTQVIFYSSYQDKGMHRTIPQLNWW